MKKIITLCAVVLTAFSMNSFSQGFYADFNVGYGIGMPANVLGQDISVDIINGEAFMSSENLMGSLGSGLNLQLTPGYMFNDHIGIELGVNYFIGTKAVMSRVSKTLDNGPLKDEDYEYREDVASSNQLRIVPSVFISTGMSNKISGYAKAGIIMPLLGSTIVETDWSKPIAPSGGVIPKEQHEMRTEVNGAPSFGFRGAIGMNYNITENISIFGEIFATSLNVKQKDRKTTSYLVDGYEIKDQLPLYSLEYEFVDELTPESNNSDYNSSYDASKPRQELFEKTSFSQMGIQIGVKFRF